MWKCNFETKHIKKHNFFSYRKTWCHKPVIPANQEGEEEGFQTQASLGQFTDTLSQKKEKCWGGAQWYSGPGFDSQ